MNHPILKNTLYVVGIVAAIVVTWKAIDPEDDATLTSGPNKGAPSKTELVNQVQQQEREKAELKRKADEERLQRLLVQYESLDNRRSAILARIERDNQRLFRRIARDSLAILGAETESIKTQMIRVYEEMGKMGYWHQPSPYNTAPKPGPQVKF